MANLRNYTRGGHHWWDKITEQTGVFPVSGLARLFCKHLTTFTFIRTTGSMWTDDEATDPWFPIPEPDNILEVSMSSISSIQVNKEAV